MNPPSDYLRLRTRPRLEAPPQGCVDLIYDAANGVFVKRDATGATETLGVSGDGTGITDDGTFIQKLDVQGDGIDTINSQPFCTKKITTWSFSDSPPLRQFVVGDSLSVFGGEVTTGPWMGRSGIIGLKTVNTSGTVTNHVGPSGSHRPDIWISGTGTTFAIGSSAEFTSGGRAAGDVRGDQACVAYVRGPGKGSFDLQYQVNAAGSWIPVGVGTARNFTVNTTTDVFTATGHGFTQNQGVWVSNSGGALPTASGGNLAASTNYFVILIDANTFKLARTRALAVAGTAIDITGAGTGTHTATPYSGIGINTANATADGIFATYNLPTTNFPHYRLRVTNVVDGVVDLAPLTGIYNSTGGGVIQILGGSSGGLDVATHLPATPDAVFNPFWAALAPDYVISIWADAAEVWEDGGAFDTFYNRCTAAFASTDWILVSRNPSSEPQGIAYSVSVARAQAKAQREWALRNRHTFINGHELVGGSWTVSNARGMAGDVVHPSVAGATHRDIVLWSKLPLGNIYLGGAFRTGQGDAVANHSSTSGQFNVQPLVFSCPLEATQLRFIDSGSPLDSSRTAYLQKDVVSTSRRLGFWEGASLGGYFDFGSGLIGLYPGGNNWALGKAAERWKPFFGETNISGPIIQVPDTLTGAGAVSITSTTTKLTTTGAAQALTLANGVDGQIKTIIHDVDGGSAVLTPTTKTGFTTITFTNAGESAMLQYVTTRGWIILSLRGAVAV